LFWCRRNACNFPIFPEAPKFSYDMKCDMLGPRQRRGYALKYVILTAPVNVVYPLNAAETLGSPQTFWVGKYALKYKFYIHLNISCDEVVFSVNG
jgi:hypothetical protein